MPEIAVDSGLAALPIKLLRLADPEPDRTIRLVSKRNLKVAMKLDALVRILAEAKPGKVAGGFKPKFSFHSLRHAAASLFIEQGWSAKKIQSILGHSTISMTMDVYGHLFESPEDDVEMFEKMEADLMAAGGQILGYPNDRYEPFPTLLELPECQLSSVKAAFNFQNDVKTHV